MRVSSRNPNKNKRKPTKVAATSKDIKKTPSKAFAKGFLYNKSSIMSSSKSCSDSTDESDREYEEIPYVIEIKKSYLRGFEKNSFFLFRLL